MKQQPYLVVNGEISLITTTWLKEQTPRQVSRLAKATYRQLYAYDSYHRNLLYDSGILCEVDRAQDCIVYHRLAAGAKLLRKYWPITSAKAHRSVERALT